MKHCKIPIFLFILNVLLFCGCDVNREPSIWIVDKYEISLSGDLSEFSGGITVYAFEPQSYLVCNDSIKMTGDDFVLSLEGFLPKYTLYLHYKKEAKPKNITFECCAFCIDGNEEYVLNGVVKRIDEQNNVMDSVDFSIKSFMPSQLPQDKQEYTFTTEL